MAKFTLEDTIKTFNYQQAAVVYWYCQGFSNADIASMLHYEISSVVWRMAEVYHKLGLDRSDAKGRKLHWTERRRILRETVCPIIRRLTNDNPDMLELFPLISPNVLEGNILDLRPDIPIPPSEPYIPPPEPLPEPLPLPAPGEIPPPEPPPDFYPVELYNAWLAVLEDEREEARQKGPRRVPPPEPPLVIQSEPRWRRYWRVLALGVIVLLGCLCVGVLAYWFGWQNGSPLPPIFGTGSTLFFDDFTNGKSDRWQTLYGNGNVVNNQLTFNEKTLMVLDEQWTDVEVSFDVSNMQCQQGVGNRGVTIGLRYQNPNNMVALRIFHYDDCAATWFLVQNNVWEKYTTSTFQLPPKDSKGVRNLVMNVQGNTYGSPFGIPVVIENYPSGGVALYGDPGVIIDNFKVTRFNP